MSLSQLLRGRTQSTAKAPGVSRAQSVLTTPLPLLPQGTSASAAVPASAQVHIPLDLHNHRFSILALPQQRAPCEKREGKGKSAPQLSSRERIAAADGSRRKGEWVKWFSGNTHSSSNRGGMGVSASSRTCLLRGPYSRVVLSTMCSKHSVHCFGVNSLCKC
jgi:hypothetical protein